MVLTGGGALLRDLDRLLMEETGPAGHRRRRSAHLRGARLGQGAREDGALRPDLHQRLSNSGGWNTPPRLLQAWPAPLVRLFFFASLSLALLVIDARFRYADGLRSWLALAAYPLQRAATAPIDLGDARRRLLLHAGAACVEENAAPARQGARATRRTRSATRRPQAEAAQLRRLIGAGEQLRGARRRRPRSSTPAATRTRTRSSSTAARRTACAPGSPVTDETGVVGQVTRVHPLLSEVTLVTDQRPGDPGAGGAQRPARGRLRRRRLGHARAALHGGERRHPERRPPGHLRASTAPIRRACRWRRWSRSRSDAEHTLRARGLQAGRRRRPRPLRAGAVRRARSARRARKKRRPARSGARRTRRPRRRTAMRARRTPMLA